MGSHGRRACATAFLAAVLIGCGSGLVDGEDDSDTIVNEAVACTLGRVRHPTESPEQFSHAYAGRTFYADGNHLGYDIALPEGLPIRPIACGTVRVYRPARGYGTLVVVIEHRFPRSVVVTNGRAERVSVSGFLSIYGHLRPSRNRDGNEPISIHSGDTVGPDDVIGYVQSDALNGDGAEHLHFGIRLQPIEEAMRSDRNWFRGYDATPSQRQWYADPSVFLQELMAGSRQLVRWHPLGTVIATAAQPDRYWMVDEGDTIRPMSLERLRRERLQDRVILVDPEEIRCYRESMPYASFFSTDNIAIVRFTHGANMSTVFEINRTNNQYRSFISYEAFRSWGWSDGDVRLDPASISLLERRDGTRNLGLRRMRDGTLVKGRGQSEVDVVSDGRRLPIFDWQTFLAMGYRADQIMEIDPGTLDDAAGSRGPAITMDLAASCREPNPCLVHGCDAGTYGGGKGDDVDASVSQDHPDATPSTDAGMYATACPIEYAVGSAGCLDPVQCGFANSIMVCLMGRWTCQILAGPCRLFDPDAGASPVRDVYTSFADIAVASADTLSSNDAVPPMGPRETCNGTDDDGDGQTDEDFICPLGRRGSACVTSCGTNGFRICQAPQCDWSSVCQTYPEDCGNTIDDDCDGQSDCHDAECAGANVCRQIPPPTPPMDAGTVPPSYADAGRMDVALNETAPSDGRIVVPFDAADASAGPVMRYEFRVDEAAGWSASEPYRLRDLWWNYQRCMNTGTSTMQGIGAGWYRCDLPFRLSPFVGSFFSPPHTDWGDRGNLGTVGNSPEPCTPTAGVGWRITDLVSGHSIFVGPSSGLPCVNVGTQSRHSLPVP